MIRSIRPADPLLFGLALLATLVGIFFIFDAGFARSFAQGRGFLAIEVRQQLIFLPIALVVSLFASRIPERNWLRWSTLIWGGAFIALILVEFIGHEQNGGKRWLDLGPISVQPAEFAKVAMVLYLAAVFASRKPWVEKSMAGMSWHRILDYRLMPKLVRCAPMIWVLAAVILIELENDLGTAMVLAVVAFGMAYVGGANRWTLAVGSFVAVLAVGYLVKSEPYRMERINNHFHRWEKRNVDDAGFQTTQSEMSIAKGGIIRLAPGSGRAKHVMPAATTDFLIATPAEEFGLLGSLGVIALFGSVCWRLVWLSRRAVTDFGRLFLIGIGSWIGIQGGTNVMMANGTLPAIGIPLPFLSSGGSSLIALWLAVGIAQSVVATKPVEASN